MSEEVVVLGYGPVGRAVVERLRREGRSPRVVQRHAPRDLPADVPFSAADVLDANQIAEAMRGARQIVATIGMPYDGRLWLQAWPKAMRNLVHTCEAASARLVFVDNLYMYGPQTAPLVETMPLTDYGRKPRARADATRVWQEAASRVRVAALRPPDFYGPGVTLSMLGSTTLAAMAMGKRAMLVVPPDRPHDYAYVPDIARAVSSLLDAGDDAYGQVWHMPCAPIRTTREILEIGAGVLGRKLKLTALPSPAVSFLGLFVPFARELPEMRFQWDRPYRVDASKFAARFWSDATPFEIGVAETVRSFLPKN